MKILFHGKILKNESKLLDYELKEDSNLTLFIPPQTKPQEEKKVLQGSEVPKVVVQPQGTNVLPQGLGQQVPNVQNLQGINEPLNNVQEPGLNENQENAEQQQQMVNQLLQQNQLTDEKKTMIATLEDMG